MTAETEPTAPVETPAAPAPSAEQIAAAVKEFNEASDRVAVIAKYPFLVPILNNPKT